VAILGDGKEKRSVVLKPPGALERQVEELGRILTDKALAVFLVIVNVAHLSQSR
jgi:hypothetical protein